MGKGIGPVALRGEWLPGGPSGPVEVYPDASHAPNGEYPSEIAHDLELFVSESCPPE